MVPHVPKVPRVPGEGALALASRWFAPSIVARVFEPLIADWQREWQDAPPRRRWQVSVRAFTAFCCAVVVSSPAILGESTPPAVSNRIVTRIARFALIVAVLQTLPYAWESELSLAMLLLLIPSGLALAFPFAMVGAVDAIRCDHALPPHRERAAVIKVAIGAVIFMVVFGGFVVPAANQAFRAATYERSLRAQGMDDARIDRIKSSPYAPARGLRELSTYELLTDHGFTDGTRYLSAYVGRELNNRASLALVPVSLLWLRWRLLDVPRRRGARLPATVVAIAASVGYGLLRSVDGLIEGGLNLSQGTGAWSPLVVISLALFLDSWRRTRRTAVA